MRIKADESAKERFLDEYKVSPAILIAYQLGFRSKIDIDLDPSQPTRKYMLADCKSNLHGFAMDVHTIRTVNQDGSRAEKPFGLIEFGNSRYNAMISKSGDNSVLSSINIYENIRLRSSGVLCSGVVDLHSNCSFNELVQKPETIVESFENATISNRNYKMLRARFQIELNGVRGAEACNDYL